MLRHLLFAFLLVVCTAPASSQKTAPAEAGLNPQGLERIDEWLRTEIEERRLPMAEMLIFRNGALGYHQTAGRSNLDREAALEPGQLYHLMSMTKPIVSVAFMMLYEEGHFQLQDPVAKYLPEFAELKVARATDQGLAADTDPAESQITIEQVLSHTTGYSHGLSGSKLDNEFAAALYYRPHADVAGRVSTLATLPLTAQPGTRWIYSTSPDILARLVEVFSGQTVAEFLQERLFDPLGMDDTGYNVAGPEAGRLVTNHQAGEAGLSVAAMQFPSSGITVYGGSFGLISTAADYLKFCRMLLNEGTLDGKRYLSPKTIELMTTNHVGDMRGNGEGFGLGFGIITDVAENGVPGSVGQYFWNGAYSTFFFIDPREDLIAILMSQRSPYSGYHEKMLRQMTYQALDRIKQP